MDNGNIAVSERTFFDTMARRHPSDALPHTSDAWDGGWRAGLYATAMEYAVIAPCPDGNWPETIRL